MTPPTNQHPVFFTGQMPFLSPNELCQSTEEKLILVYLMEIDKQQPWPSGQGAAFSPRVQSSNQINTTRIPILDCFYRPDALPNRQRQSALEALCDYALYKSTFTFTLHYTEATAICMTYKRSCDYLHQGGYVSIGICLFVSGIMQNQPNRFSQNSVERWHMGHGRSY